MSESAANLKIPPAHWMQQTRFAHLHLNSQLTALLYINDMIIAPNSFIIPQAVAQALSAALQFVCVFHWFSNCLCSFFLCVFYYFFLFLLIFICCQFVKPVVASRRCRLRYEPHALRSNQTLKRRLKLKPKLRPKLSVRPTDSFRFQPLAERALCRQIQSDLHVCCCVRAKNVQNYRDPSGERATTTAQRRRSLGVYLRFVARDSTLITHACHAVVLALPHSLCWRSNTCPNSSSRACCIVTCYL